jgi:hypothetical protein
MHKVFGNNRVTVVSAEVYAVELSDEINGEYVSDVVQAELDILYVRCHLAVDKAGAHRARGVAAVGEFQMN